MKYLAAFGLLSLAKQGEKGKPSAEEVVEYLGKLGIEGDVKEAKIVIETICEEGGFDKSEDSFLFSYFVELKGI